MQSVTLEETITVAITGASGSRYALRLIECLLQADKRVFVLVSKAAQMVLAMETDLKLPSQQGKMQEAFRSYFKVNAERLQVYGLEQWTSPVASGSGAPHRMVVCPCSTGTLSAIATGACNNLIERAADVAIKERRQLVLVPRETPFSAIHLENMLKLSQLGVTIMPAAPGFYRNPQTVEELIDFIVARILDHLGIEQTLVERWGES